MNIIEKSNDYRLSKIACDKPQDERLKITEENYEGYVELFTLRYSTEEDMKAITKFVGYEFLGLIIMVPSFFIPAFAPLFVGGCIGFEVINTTSFFHKIIKSRKERKQKIKEKYPYVNFKTDALELRQALQDCGILTTKVENGYSYFDIDLENYRRNLLSFKMLKGSDMELPNCMKESVSKRIDKSKSEEVMDDFMEKLEDGHFDRSEPQVKDEFNPTPEFIEQTISNYQKLLDLGLIPSFEEDVTEEAGLKLQKINKENK